MGVWIISVDNNIVIADYFRPARYRGNHGIKRSHFAGFNGVADKQAADNTFVNKCLTWLEIATGNKLRHSRRCAGPAGRAINTAVTIKHGIAGAR